jgi:hypothetical protein
MERKMSVVFDYEDIEPVLHGRARWFFTAAMVSTCEPLFNECEDNYEVRDKLERAGVIDSTVEEDSESCQLWCHFDSKADGESFIDRLNEYLAKKHTFRAAVARF